jgi:filamentous hemagglutinin
VLKRTPSYELDVATPITPPSTYKGDAYQLPDGTIFGLRESTNYGLTIDILKSIDPFIKNGFKVHYK